MNGERKKRREGRARGGVYIGVAGGDSTRGERERSHGEREKKAWEEEERGLGQRKEEGEWRDRARA